MTRLAVDYARLVRGLRAPLMPADLGAALLGAVAELGWVSRVAGMVFNGWWL